MTTDAKGFHLPPDDLARTLALAQPNKPGSAIHLGVAGGTYTILVSSDDTAGRFCLIDMFVPPGGGPPPHRHDFEETFVLLEGELAFTFRGQTQTIQASETVNIPSNAPHRFQNSSSQPARMLCICAPGGQDKFFMEVGVRVDGPRTPAPPPDPATRAQTLGKIKELSAKYRTEILGSV